MPLLSTRVKPGQSASQRVSEIYEGEVDPESDSEVEGTDSDAEAGADAETETEAEGQARGMPTRGQTMEGTAGGSTSQSQPAVEALQEWLQSQFESMQRGIALQYDQMTRRMHRFQSALEEIRPGVYERARTSFPSPPPPMQTQADTDVGADGLGDYTYQTQESEGALLAAAEAFLQSSPMASPELSPYVPPAQASPAPLPHGPVTAQSPRGPSVVRSHYSRRHRG